MIENALVAGFTSVGMDVLLTGPIPTPAVGMLARSMRADLGVMISASHNPFDDNGIKLFGPDGYKLSDEREAETGPAAARRKKRLEYLVLDSRGDARACISEFQNYLLCFQIRVTTDSKLASSVHGVRSIDHEVGEDLLEFTWISQNLRKIWLQFLDDLDIVKECLAPQEFHAVADNLVHIKNDSFLQRLPAELQQPRDNLLAPQSLVDDFL
jgi:hypothetical protein